jgi:hypothetical protein
LAAGANLVVTNRSAEGQAVVGLARSCEADTNAGVEASVCTNELLNAHTDRSSGFHFSSGVAGGCCENGGSKKTLALGQIVDLYSSVFSA